MPDLPERKVGIIACSGEELAVGTVSRLAALKVLHDERPGKTVTICLPLFLAGGEGDRTFARFYPTITIDGCELRCAARGTEMYSGQPTASVVVSELAAANGIGTVDGRRKLNEAGTKAVDLTAQCVVDLVDKMLATKPAVKPLVSIAPAQKPAKVECACASGIPVQTISIEGNPVDFLALPLIFSKLRDGGRSPEVAGDEVMANVEIYNEVPRESKAAYRAAILREYELFWKGGSR